MQQRAEALDLTAIRISWTGVTRPPATGAAMISPEVYCASPVAITWTARSYRPPARAAAG